MRERAHGARCTCWPRGAGWFMFGGVGKTKDVLPTLPGRYPGQNFFLLSSPFTRATKRSASSFSSEPHRLSGATLNPKP